jgi:endoribonuclease Dicer
LLHSLLKGTLAITQFHVLVIGNAQNILDQDSHAFVPLVQVMNNFYRVTDPLSRPRVFALATPPADREFPFDSAMLKLEQTLDSKVVGVSVEKRKEILALPDCPNEVVVLYDTSIQPTTTRLFKQLQQCDPLESVFRKHFRASRHVLAELGACASDLIWRRALKEMESTVSPWYEEDEEDDDEGSLSPADKQRRIWDIVKNWPFTMPNLDPRSRGFNVTHKFLKLVKILKSCEPYGEGFRGVVFGMLRLLCHICCIYDLVSAAKRCCLCSRRTASYFG